MAFFSKSKIALLLALALALGWGFRVDGLRASWKQKYEVVYAQMDKVVLTLRVATGDPKLRQSGAVDAIKSLDANRDAWEGTSKLQSDRIDALAAEGERLKKLNAELRVKAEAAIAKREQAIQRLRREALTPGERADCAAQISAANEALDLVYSEGL